MKDFEIKWKDSVPDQLKSIGTDSGELNIKEMLHNNKVIGGLIAAVLGIILAFISAKFFSGNLRIFISFLASAIAISGTGMITNYINSITDQQREKFKKK